MPTQANYRLKATALTQIADTAKALTEQATVAGLATMLTASGANKTFTTDALKNAPTGGGSAPTKEEIAAEVVTEMQADGTVLQDINGRTSDMEQMIDHSGETLTWYKGSVNLTDADKAAIAQAAADDITADHGSGPYGAGLTYANTITLVAEDSSLAGLPGVSWTFKNATGLGIQVAKTDLNGDGTTTLPNGLITVICAVEGYTFAIFTVTVAGDQTITATGTPLPMPVPPTGTLQTLKINAGDLGLNPDASAQISITYQNPNEVVGIVNLTQGAIVLWYSAGQYWYAYVAKGAAITISATSSNQPCIQVSGVVTDDDSAWLAGLITNGVFQ